MGIASVLSHLEMIVLVEAHAMIGLGPGNSPTLQFLTSRMLFPMRDAVLELINKIHDESTLSSFSLRLESPREGAHQMALNLFFRIFEGWCVDLKKYGFVVSCSTPQFESATSHRRGH